MSPFSMFVVYLLIWWVTLFGVLPLGVRGQAEEGDIVPGSDPGAPVQSDMKRKAILTTKIATVIWLIVCIIIYFRLITWDMLAALIGLDTPPS